MNEGCNKMTPAKGEEETKSYELINGQPHNNMTDSTFTRCLTTTNLIANQRSTCCRGRGYKLAVLYCKYELLEDIAEIR